MLPACSELGVAADVSLAVDESGSEGGLGATDGALAAAKGGLGHDERVLAAVAEGLKDDEGPGVWQQLRKLSYERTEPVTEGNGIRMQTGFPQWSCREAAAMSNEQSIMLLIGMLIGCSTAAALRQLHCRNPVCILVPLLLLSMVSESC